MKKLQMAMAISLILGAEVVLANPVVNVQHTEGTADYQNITNSANVGSTGSVNNYQVSGNTTPGDLGITALSNPRDSNQDTLAINSGASDTVAVTLGQGSYYDGSNWVNSAGSTGYNLIHGTITKGTANISQTSDHNTVNLSLNGTGQVDVQQGYAGTTSTGGYGFTAAINQQGIGAIKIDQGNSSGNNPVTAGKADVYNAGGGAIHITQNSNVNTNTGNVIASVGSGGTGTLTVNQSNNGNVFVSNQGFSTATASASNAIVLGSGSTTNIYNDGLGSIALTQVGTSNIIGVNVANTTNVDKLLIKSGGTGNNVYVALDAGSGTYLTPATIHGDLTLNQEGTGSGNILKVASYGGGKVVVNQGTDGGVYNISNSSLLLTGTATTGDSILNQNASNQTATATSINGSVGTVNMNSSGTENLIF